MTNQEKQQEALARATQGATLSNYPAIFQGFMSKGIPQHDIRPRENIFTFNAWKALGKSVKKGEHGVKVITVITTSKEKEDPDTGEMVTVAKKRPWTTTVFHESQVH